MPKTKKFIDKKNATTFVLANRSQRDPLISDETAPKNILLPLDQVPNLGAPGPSSSAAYRREKDDPKETASKRKEEQLKYGIYFDDDYDYLQHLKDTQEVSSIQWDFCERIPAPSVDQSSENVKKEDLKDFKLRLPSSVFESEYREDIGLLNKAAVSAGPRPDLDPDVIAALDDDFDYDDPRNELEDNFMELASGGGPLEVDEGGQPSAEDLDGLFSDEENDNSSNYSDEAADSLGSLRGEKAHQRLDFPDFSDGDSDDENKSRFTNYSMSSSVVRRNKQLLLVDDRFEKMFEGYDDTEIGALDCDEIEGDINPDSDLLMKYAEEFEKDRKKEELVNEKIKNLAVKDEEDDDDANTFSDSSDDQEKERWDCESILSTYSNTKNRPKVIKEPSKRIRINGRTGMPIDVLGKGLTKQNLKQLDNEYDNANEVAHRGVAARSLMSGATSIRNKDETPEARRERKKLVKEYRKERRLERKANIEAFKDEKKRLVKVRLNDKNNVNGLKL